MNALINNVNVEFIIENEVVFCDTLKLARVFEQEHKNILQTIKNLPFSDFNEQNFRLVSYVDSRGRKQPCYNLTRDGFSLLVMGFTGEKAYKWKIEFIKAFNLMEAELKRLSVSRYVDKIADLEAYTIKENEHHQDQINGYLGQIAKHNQKIEVLKAELVLAKQSPNLYERIAMLELELKNAKADAHNYKLDMNFYMRKYRELKDESVKTENVSIKALDTIQGQMEHIFTAIDAVKSFINDGDEYFMREKGLLKG
ncbi:Rha family transcriptional regulator [Campylobacter californiensis]|uniref:Rha family transcriptional regulator n=1 Tax=Campylobacter californiensis TaxID=1032243 RepID=UPI00147299CD|nr:Rha family transcriptional regulator [Campylobacter sp. RM12916]MBE3610521.1 Rha family transcriptional regulator [Campylobacter sp. RM12916]